MSDVFISYVRTDSALADKVAAALEGFGISTWIDRRGIEEGRAYDRQIEDALAAAGCVVVLWSKASVQSDWVRSEAAEGFARGKLLPVLTDDCTPPLQLKTVHATDFRFWDGSATALETHRLVEAVRRRMATASDQSLLVRAQAHKPGGFRALLERAEIAFADRGAERRYSSFFVEMYLAQLRMFLLLGAVLFASFAVMDFLIGRSTPISSLAQFILTPNVVICFLLTLWPPIKRIWRLFIVLGSGFCILLIVIGLTRATAKDGSDSFPLLLPFLLAVQVYFGLVPTRFLDCLLIGGTLFAIVTQYPRIEGVSEWAGFEQIEVSLTVFASIIVSSWWRERHTRRLFLSELSTTYDK